MKKNQIGKVFLLGGTGQIGAPLYEKLATQNLDVDVYSRGRIQSIGNKNINVANKETWHSIKFQDYDTLILGAPSFPILECEKFPINTRNVNVELLAEFVNLFRSDCSIFFFSTSLIWDRNYISGEINSEYGRQKKDFEEILLSTRQSCSIYRLGKVASDKWHFLENLIYRLNSNLDCQVFENHYFSPVDVNSVIDVVGKDIIQIDERPNVRNLVSNIQISYLDAAKWICERFNFDSNLITPIIATEKDAYLPLFCQAPSTIEYEHELVYGFDAIENISIKILSKLNY